MIQTAIAKLVEGKDLTLEEARQSVGEILEGRGTPSLVAGFLVGLRMKGETVDEMAGCAQAMMAAATRIRLDGVPVVVDTCGTGGDSQGSFNISTTAAFSVAGAGLTVAKHGNRAVSSVCGSGDALEALGIKIDPGPAIVERCLREIGIGFLFAPAFHPAMKNVMLVRRELGIRTVFNLLGPLCNPAGANVQVIGVPSLDLVDKVAQVLVRLGTTHSLVVHGQGYDEIVLSGATGAAEIVEGRVIKRTFVPQDFGLPRHSLSALVGGSKEENGEKIKGILRGEKGPARDAVVANAGAALWIASQAIGCSVNLKEACQMAQKSIDTGAARDKWERLVAMSQG
jgi:anthranilate phosphoribosyltransferase